MAGLTRKERRELDRLSKRYLSNLKPSRLRRIRDYRKLRIGDKVRCSRNGYPMTVTGIFKLYSNLEDLTDATLYLDFEDNEGDIWEEELRDVEWCGSSISVLWKKLFR